MPMMAGTIQFKRLLLYATLYLLDNDNASLNVKAPKRVHVLKVNCFVWKGSSILLQQNRLESHRYFIIDVQIILKNIVHQYCYVSCRAMLRYKLYLRGGNITNQFEPLIFHIL
jgi:hypothetical protein